MEKEFLTVEDVAEKLGFSKRTVRELFSKGEIKGRKVKGKYITTRDLLKEFIEKGGKTD